MIGLNKLQLFYPEYFDPPGIPFFNTQIRPFKKQFIQSITGPGIGDSYTISYLGIDLQQEFTPVNPLGNPTCPRALCIKGIISPTFPNSKYKAISFQQYIMIVDTSTEVSDYIFNNITDTTGLVNAGIYPNIEDLVLSLGVGNIIPGDDILNALVTIKSSNTGVPESERGVLMSGIYYFI